MHKYRQIKKWTYCTTLNKILKIYISVFLICSFQCDKHWTQHQSDLTDLNFINSYINNAASWFFAGLMLASWSSKGKPFMSSGFRKRWVPSCMHFPPVKMNNNNVPFSFLHHDDDLCSHALKSSSCWSARTSKWSLVKQKKETLMYFDVNAKLLSVHQDSLGLFLSYTCPIHPYSLSSLFPSFSFFPFFMMVTMVKYAL